MQVAVIIDLPRPVLKGVLFFSTGNPETSEDKVKEEIVHLLVGDVYVTELQTFNDESPDLTIFRNVSVLPPNILLTPDGILTMNGDKSENVSLSIQGDKGCGFTLMKKFWFKVSNCPCLNNGTCHRFKNYTFGSRE